MKSKLSSVALVAVVAGLVHISAPFSEARTFKSADGKHEMEGAIMGVQDTAQGRLVDFKKVDGSRTQFLVTLLSAEDQEYVDGLAQTLAAGRSLQARIADAEERGEPVERSGRKIVTTEHAFRVEFSNTGSVGIEDLEVEYQIFYRKDRREGALDHERTDETEFGTIKLPAVPAGEAIVLTTEAIPLVNDRVNRGGPG